MHSNQLKYVDLVAGRASWKGSVGCLNLYFFFFPGLDSTNSVSQIQPYNSDLHRRRLQGFKLLLSERQKYRKDAPCANRVETVRLAPPGTPKPGTSGFLPRLPSALQLRPLPRCLQGRPLRRYHMQAVGMHQLRHKR